MKSDNVTLDVEQYSLTSASWKGEIICTYRQMLLIKLDIANAELSEKQHIWFLHNMPRELAELQKLCSGNKNLMLTHIQTEVTFLEFWNKYNEKERSSKKKSEQRWNKLSKHDRVRAYRYIDVYLKNLPAWQSKKIAETYLNSEIWNN